MFLCSPYVVRLLPVLLLLHLQPSSTGAVAGGAPLPFGQPAPGLELVWDRLGTLVTSALSAEQTELEVRTTVWTIMSLL